MGNFNAKMRINAVDLHPYHSYCRVTFVLKISIIIKIIKLPVFGCVNALKLSHSQMKRTVSFEYLHFLALPYSTEFVV